MTTPKNAVQIVMPRPATPEQPTSYALVDTGHDTYIARLTYKPMTYNGRSLGDQHMEAMTLPDILTALLEDKD